MYQKIPIILTSLCVRELLTAKIRLAMVIWAENQGLSVLPETIPLSRVKNHSSIVYRCSLAFPLSSQHKLSPLTIAQQLLNSLLFTVTDDPDNQPSLEFNLEVSSQGWIDFFLSDRSLALWLEHLPFLLPQWQDQPKNDSNWCQHIFFPIQYVHARCCSLLRLADEQGLIQLSSQDFDQPLWYWSAPQPLPWLVNNHFRLVHPREQALINQIFTIIEARSYPSSANWLKLATSLSNSWLEFYRDCRIWGETKEENRELAQARLGLIALTQVTLRSLLQNQLGVVPLLEL